MKESFLNTKMGKHTMKTTKFEENKLKSIVHILEFL